MEKNRNGNQQPVSGREAWINRYRAGNPNSGEDIQDSDLWEYANTNFSELDGKYNRLNEVNTGLAQKVIDDPRLGAALSMISGESKSLPYAIASVYGRDFLENDLEEFEKGYQAHLQSLAQSKKEQEEAQENFKVSMENILSYAQENQLTEEQQGILFDGLMEFANNLLMGILPSNLIDLVHKGLNYEQDVQEAALTGEIEGRNQKIDAKKKEMSNRPQVPDIRTGSSGGRSNRPLPSKEKGSFYDEIKEEI